jgi:peroxiredoxin family protein
MPDEPKKFKDLLDDSDQDRVAFLVYKKAMTLLRYTAGVLALGLAVVVFFGLDAWHDLSASIKDVADRVGKIEKRADEAQTKLDEAQKLVNHLAKDSQEVTVGLQENQVALKDAQVESGRMMQIATEMNDLKSQVASTVQHDLETARLSRDAETSELDEKGKSLDTEIKDSKDARAEHAKMLDAFQTKMLEIRKEVDKSSETGMTILVLQDKRSTWVEAQDLKEHGFKATLGDATVDDNKAKVVKNVKLVSGTNQLAESPSMRENDVLEFTSDDIDKAGKKLTYRFKILNINVLALRDLVTCELRWQPEEPAAQVVAKR